MKYFFTILFSFIGMNGFAQINWNEFQERHKENPKMMMVYFYTDWCSVCKIQDKQIEKSPTINNFLDNDVYYIKLNAEDETPIQLNGKTFTSSSLITYYLGFSRVDFPLWIILDEHYQLMDYYTGLISVKQFRLLIDKILSSKKYPLTTK